MITFEKTYLLIVADREPFSAVSVNKLVESLNIAVNDRNTPKVLDLVKMLESIIDSAGHNSDGEVLIECAKATYEIREIELSIRFFRKALHSFDVAKPTKYALTCIMLGDVYYNLNQLQKAFTKWETAYHILAKLQTSNSVEYNLVREIYIERYSITEWIKSRRQSIDAQLPGDPSTDAPPPPQDS